MYNFRMLPANTSAVLKREMVLACYSSHNVSLEATVSWACHAARDSCAALPATGCELQLHGSFAKSMQHTLAASESAGGTHLKDLPCQC